MDYPWNFHRTQQEQLKQFVETILFEIAHEDFASYWSKYSMGDKLRLHLHQLEILICAPTWFCFAHPFYPLKWFDLVFKALQWHGIKQFTNSVQPPTGIQNETASGLLLGISFITSSCCVVFFTSGLSLQGMFDKHYSSEHNHEHEYIKQTSDNTTWWNALLTAEITAWTSYEWHNYRWPSIAVMGPHGTTTQTASIYRKAGALLLRQYSVHCNFYQEL